MSDKEPHNPKSRLKKWQTTAQAAKLYGCTSWNFSQKAKRLGLKGEKRGTGRSLWWDVHDMFDRSFSAEWVECIIGAQYCKMTRMQFAAIAKRIGISRRVVGNYDDGRPLYEYLMTDIKAKVNKGSNTCQTKGCKGNPEMVFKGRHLCRDCACPDLPITEEDRVVAMSTGCSVLGSIGSSDGDTFGRSELDKGIDRYMHKIGIKIKRKSNGVMTVRT